MDGVVDFDLYLLPLVESGVVDLGIGMQHGRLHHTSILDKKLVFVVE